MNESTQPFALLPRRDFLTYIGLSATGALLARMPVMAGPFTREDFGNLVPADKKLSADWIKSLVTRGTPELWSGDQLKYIGMPIGGIGAGQLYLGGDGKLWHWDIFNQHLATTAAHYAKPLTPSSPVDHGFTLDGKPLEKFSHISFRGEYPMGLVTYREADTEVTLEAFSPFIPLNTNDSSLPATVMRFTVKNTGSKQLNAVLAGQIAKDGMIPRIVRGKGFTFLELASEKSPTRPEADIVFEDWNRESYDHWTVTGNAFGNGPIRKSAIPQYQGDVGGDSERVVNSHASAPGDKQGAKDDATGKLSSRPFKIERRFINFWIGGGNHVGKTCLNLLVDGKVVLSATGGARNRMKPQSFDVRQFQGKEALIEIVDAQEGAWGHIGVGKITFSDQNAAAGKPEAAPDFGSMGLALLGGGDSLSRTLTLEPGQSAVVTFLVTWYFPNLKMPKLESPPYNGTVLPEGRYYATQFDSAFAVAGYLTENIARLTRDTTLWRDTWYDSTLPYWFLDRTMLNTSTLASSTCYRFKNGRFYGWEGVGCCSGTCTHVWHYAHAVGRLFPELERNVREGVDFGVAQKADGAIPFRGELLDRNAVDGQAGTILRALREHQMSADDGFLKKNWPGIKKATQWLIRQDPDGDGIMVGSQHNTLDAAWYGAIAWLSGLYLAALEATAVMADAMQDTDFAKQCREVSARGQKNITAQLFDGEYYINKPDPKHLAAINTGTGCEIDQVMGQSWAWQVGLPRVFPEKETKSALRSLWKYNFTPDVGPYRAVNKPGRWYALAGESGLLMCTFPRSDWDYKKASGKGPGWIAGYFNECMNGFEYQVASHMVWEGLLMEGMAVTRAVHDRYSPTRRNPYNEVECGDHYARSMASYGVYLAACGFEYDGPKAHIGFAPRITPENFKAAFTSAEGWGSYSQKSEASGQKSAIEVKHGKLRLKTIALASEEKSVKVRLNGKELSHKLSAANGRVVITLAAPLTLEAGQTLEVSLTS